jgi:alpha-L-arabinofuranosidase
MADAVVVGSMLIALLRNTDRVHGANLAQLVNVIAPIVTEPGAGAWKQTIFHPFEATSRLARGVVLGDAPTGPVIDTAKYGEARAIDSVSTWDEESGSLTTFAVNRSATEPVTLNIDVRDMPAIGRVRAQTLADADPHRIASAADANAIGMRDNSTARVEGGTVTISLPPVSWTVITAG